MTISPSRITAGFGDIFYLSQTQKKLVAEVCFTTEKTVRRWRESANFPQWARRLVELQADCFYDNTPLDAITLSWPKWSGITLTPNGITSTRRPIAPSEFDLLLWKAAFYDRGRRKDYLEPAYVDTPPPQAIQYRS